MAQKKYYNSPIKIDSSAPSLCPRGVKEIAIPGYNPGFDQQVPDLMSGVNQLMGEDMSNISKQRKMTKKA